MRPLNIPQSYNYIGIFLTFACNLSCSYCINNFEDKVKARKSVSGKDWVKLLNRIESRPDLPVTFQGGEPNVHPDFIYIINNLKPEINIDILTNLQFDIDEFIKKVNPERLKRQAPYASIRVSYHPETMDLDDTVKRTLEMLKAGFSIGIWGILHPSSEGHIKETQKRCRDSGIDFRTKEFLGEHNGRIYGTYKYPDACAKKLRKKVLCKATELLVDSEGYIFRCHHDLYKGINSIDTLFNPDFEIRDIYRDCGLFGFCNPCDVKLKTDRFQEYGHAYVDIKHGISR
jgi:MoaA/NifB/PqqE/SkfB family radical SAM enzyme